MEVVELYTSYSSTDARGNGLASISDKIRHREYFGGLFLIFLVLHFEVPVVGELQLEAGVVGRLYDDDVGAEVGAQKEAQCLDHVGPLWLATRQAARERKTLRNETSGMHCVTGLSILYQWHNQGTTAYCMTKGYAVITMEGNLERCINWSIYAVSWQTKRWFESHLS